jgi:SAM-dependent methyltransferase
MSANDSSAGISRDHFSTLVTEWSHIGRPLRPSPDDTAVVQRVIDGLGSAPHIVVLGVTPEIVGASWPVATELTAVDHSPSMIRALWNPDRAPAGARAIEADWRTMPIVSETIDLVAGDGCYIVLAHPDEYEALTREVHRILRPGGRFVIRVFLRPERTESLAEIAAAFGAGHIGSVHALKLRLLAALHVNSATGTPLVDVWHAWKTFPPLPPALAGQRGWTPGEITAIESYRTLAGRFYLPTLAEIRAIFQPHFTELECATASYELGERCPTFVLSRT